MFYYPIQSLKAVIFTSQNILISQLGRVMCKCKQIHLQNLVRKTQVHTCDCNLKNLSIFEQFQSLTENEIK